MNQIDSIITTLKNGGTALVPTDTVYGLLALPSNPDSVTRIYQVKQRPLEMKLPIALPLDYELTRLGIKSDPAIDAFLASRFMPGAISIIAEIDNSQSPDWLAGREEIAFRIPDNKLLLDLLSRTGPLLMTSANIHGKPTEKTMEKVLEQLEIEPDLCIDGGERQEVPSTIVNCTYTPPSIQREGVVSKQVISTIYR